MQEDFYMVKKIFFENVPKSILTQNKNGPCPLLALANALIIKGKIHVHSDYSCVAHQDLIQMIADALMERDENVYSDENRCHRLNDAIMCLPKLAFGLDVNIKFHDVTGFEFTADREVFDLMNVQLVHGWVVENQIEAEALGSFSYNQAIDYILSFPDTEKAVIIKDFFQKSASQLTEKGLTSLRNYLTNGQLAIFFRNNHFSTIIKFGFEIYALATDVAFTEVDEVVWECISGVSGNNFYSDSNFIPINSNNRGQESNELYQTIELEKFENEDYIMNQILIISQAEGNIVEKNRLENEKQEKQEKEKEKKREKMEKEKQEKGKKRNDERVNADADVNSDISLVIVKKKEGNKKIKKCTCEIW